MLLLIFIGSILTLMKKIKPHCALTNYIPKHYLATAKNKEELWIAWLLHNIKEELWIVRFCVEKNPNDFVANDP